MTVNVGRIMVSLATTGLTVVANNYATHNEWITGILSALIIVCTHLIPAVNQEAAVTQPTESPRQAPEPGSQAPELENPVGVRGSDLMGVPQRTAPDPAPDDEVKDDDAVMNEPDEEAPRKGVAGPVLSLPAGSFGHLSPDLLDAGAAFFRMIADALDNRH